MPFLWIEELLGTHTEKSPQMRWFYATPPTTHPLPFNLKKLKSALKYTVHAASPYLSSFTLDPPYLPGSSISPVWTLDRPPDCGLGCLLVPASVSLTVTHGFLCEPTPALLAKPFLIACFNLCALIFQLDIWATETEGKQTAKVVW